MEIKVEEIRKLQEKSIVLNEKVLRIKTSSRKYEKYSKMHIRQWVMEKEKVLYGTYVEKDH